MCAPRSPRAGGGAGGRAARAARGRPEPGAAPSASGGGGNVPPPPVDAPSAARRSRSRRRCEDVPYGWGGASPSRIRCLRPPSCTCMRSLGVSLPHNAAAPSTQCSRTCPSMISSRATASGLLQRLRPCRHLCRRRRRRPRAAHRDGGAVARRSPATARSTAPPAFPADSAARLPYVALRPRTCRRSRPRVHCTAARRARLRLGHHHRLDDPVEVVDAAGDDPGVVGERVPGRACAGRRLASDCTVSRNSGRFAATRMTLWKSSLALVPLLARDRAGVSVHRVA